MAPDPVPSAADDEAGQSPPATVGDLAALVAAVHAGEVIPVEALGAAFYADARLPGAVHLPPGRVDELAPRLLPDLEASVVVYCSRGCTNAEATARRLLELGYRDVRVLAGGKERWIEAGLPVEREP